ncbi:hypothetical protein WJX84_008709 [Apatococcus fuscideae]|uniref:ubiquitinyl hydrolase 1 n=1 Tax=Apatococcus fuscideae TaxID=2026836 RepID=A0AAW1T8G8_9CHLO
MSQTGDRSPDRVSTFSTWQQHPDNIVDGAESRPTASVGEHSLASVGEVGTEVQQNPSVSSHSAPAYSSDGSRPTVDDAQPQKSEQVTSERPTDEQILAQENQIKAEEAQRHSLIGGIEPLSELAKEYEAGSSVFVNKIKTVESTYRSIRRARGDGNCFFRSFVFAYMEQLVNLQDLAERNRVVTCIRQWEKKLVEAGFDLLVFEDPQMIVIDQLNSLGTSDPLKVSVLESNMLDAELANHVVMYFRMITSAALQLRADFFAPFIMGMSDEGLTVEQFRRKCVEPMGEESDHVHIVALTDALQVPIRVVYLDRSLNIMAGGFGGGDDSAQVNHHDFFPEPASPATSAASRPTVPRVHLLYRPGHYDILYPI